MAGTIVVDRLESDASYASSINVASPLVVSNTISLGSAAAISGNLNIRNSNVTVNTAQTSSFTVAGSTAGAFGIRVRQIQSGNTLTFGFDNSALSEILAPEAFRIRINSAGTATTAIYADPNGHITLPVQSYAQLVYLDATGILRNNLIPWSTVRVNRNSAYNNSTRLFTCPSAGIYFVSCTAVRNTGYTAGSGDSFAINKNGVSYISSYYSSTVVGTVEAAGGDTIGLFYSNDSPTVYLKECYATIWLLG